MQWTAFIVCLALATSLVVADRSSETETEAERAPRLIGGTNSPWGQFPAAVSINTTFNVHCGGAVVDRQHVLTAAQCVFNTNRRLIDPYWIKIHAGDIALAPVGSRRQTRRVTQIFVHPEFNFATLEHDVAVLRLDRPYELPSNTLNVANRTRRIVPNGVACQYVGWGTTGPAPTAAVSVLQRFLPMTINDRELCNQATMHAGRIQESMLCAGNTGASNNAAPCNGNAGNGLYCDRALVGILTFGANCGAANNPPVFTQVRFYNNWIEQQFNQTQGRPFGWTPGQI
ncbi:trypsin alpha-3-like [Anopheles albimanus]|uniref:trypsin alpha-3-like n=1 Tax=Anopheles albimanus TaxID=7167 RepID=UPI00163FD9EC|nr:trypsin alpha-3-like [Anopheles albimanus]